MSKPLPSASGRGSGCWAGSPRPGYSCVLPSLTPQEGVTAHSPQLGASLYSGFLCTDLGTLPGLLVCSIPCVYLCEGVGISFMLWVMTQPSLALLLQLLRL